MIFWKLLLIQEQPEQVLSIQLYFQIKFMSSEITSAINNLRGDQQQTAKQQMGWFYQSTDCSQFSVGKEHMTC